LDEFVLAQLVALNGDIMLVRLDPVPPAYDIWENARWFDTLVTPDDFFKNWWSALLVGGPQPADMPGSKADWIAYGRALEEWIAFKGEIDSNTQAARNLCPDFRNWQWSQQIEVTKLSYLTAFDRGSVLRVADYPILKTLELIEYHPLLHMPCCGVGKKQNGDLVPFGAFASLIDAEKDGQWLWDDGSIRKALISPQQKSAPAELVVQPEKLSAPQLVLASVFDALRAPEFLSFPEKGEGAGRLLKPKFPFEMRLLSTILEKRNTSAAAHAAGAVQANAVDGGQAKFGAQWSEGEAHYEMFAEGDAVHISPLNELATNQFPQKTHLRLLWIDKMLVLKHEDSKTAIVVGLDVRKLVDIRKVLEPLTDATAFEKSGLKLC